MSTLEFREATPQDVPYLTQLRLRTIHEHLLKAGTDLTFEEHELRAQTRLNCCALLVMAGRTVGIVKVVRTGESWTIEQLQIEPEFQGRGFGSAVIRQLQRDARASGVVLLLSVQRVNPALALYERLGFESLGESHGIVEMRSAGCEVRSERCRVELLSCHGRRE